MPPFSSEFASASDLPNAFSAKSIRVDGLNADFFYGVSDRPQKTLILLGGSEGGKSWSNHTARIKQFIEQGYAVLSLAYFGVDGLPAHLRAIPLEYFTRAFLWLSSQKEVIPHQYMLLGVSRGAELALLIGSMVPEVKAVVAIAPSSVVFPGPPTGILDALLGQHSPWSLQGHEIAFVPLPYSWITLQGMITGKRTRMFEEALRNTDAMKAAAIPVEKTRGSILLESFTQDQIWPSTLMADQLVDRLNISGFRYTYKHNAYNTTHSNWSFEPCWANILAFLREYHPVE
jgi:uncharacterized protein